MHELDAVLAVLGLGRGQQPRRDQLLDHRRRLWIAQQLLELATRQDRARAIRGHEVAERDSREPLLVRHHLGEGRFCVSCERTDDDVAASDS